MLFSIYIDNLLSLLSRSGVGCYIGPHFIGALAYADDIVLIAPTASAMRRLLRICSDYANEFDILFNPSKTKCLIAAPSARHYHFDRDHLSNFTIDGKPIEYVLSFKHLGHMISSNLADIEDIALRKSDFTSQTNNTLCFFKSLDPFVRCKLFRAYCTSLYGCELWLLTNDAIEGLCRAWRKGLRTVWRLPYRTHNFLLPIISRCLPVFDEICRRSLNFIRSCISHPSQIVPFVALHGILYGRGASLCGTNVLFCIQRYGISYYKALRTGFPIDDIFSSFAMNSLTENEHCAAAFLTELLYVRDHQLHVNYLSSDEISALIDYVCTCCGNDMSNSR